MISALVSRCIRIFAGLFSCLPKLHPSTASKPPGESSLRHLDAPSTGIIMIRATCATEEGKETAELFSFEKGLSLVGGHLNVLLMHMVVSDQCVLCSHVPIIVSGNRCKCLQGYWIRHTACSYYNCKAVAASVCMCKFHLARL